MRAYILLLLVFLAVLLLPAHLAIASSSSSQQSGVRPNRILLRRSSRNPLRIASPRHRLSRYIQEQSEQQHEIQQQERGPDDAEIDSDLEFLMNQAFGQPQLQQQQSSTPTSPSNGGFTHMPHSYSGPTSTQKTAQFKEDLSQISQSPHQSSAAEDGFEMDLSQKFMPQSHEIQPYSQMRQTAQQGQNSHGNGANRFNTVGHSLSVVGESGQESDFDELQNLNSIDGLKNSIRGEPGKDYPILDEIPMTNFKCSDHQWPGYYSDIETQCQVFHVCQPDGRHNAFLCPNGTIFSQRHFVCVWWYEFNCAESEQYYDLNAQLYKEDRGSASRGVGSVQINAPGGFLPSSGSGSTGNSAGYGPSGVAPSSNAGLHQLSPKEHLTQMYQNQIDGFSVDMGPMTTSAPVYYSNGKTTPSKANNGMNDGYNTRPKLSSRYEPSSYGGDFETAGVTPGPIVQESYETTPYNLDAALGEEIHSETPLIESLPLTTILPHVEKAVDMAMANRQGTKPAQYYGSQKIINGGFGGEKFGTNDNGGRSRPPYTGGVKGSPNGSDKSMKMPPESPAKNGRGSNGNGNRNGGSLSSSASSKKSMNGYKPYPSYGTKI